MIGITGAAGPFGRAVTRAVLRTVQPHDVVLGTRSPHELDDLSALGVHVRHADFDEPEALKAAFGDVDRLLLISTDKVGSRLDQHRAAVEAAAAAGVSYIAYTSVPSPVAQNPAAVVPDHAGTEQALRDSGLHWTMLRNHLYSHMQIPALQNAAATGRLVTNIGEGRSAFVTREDCAEAAAAVLIQSGFEDRVLDISGPEAVGVHDLLSLAKQLRGDEVELVQVEDDQLIAGLQAAGLPEQAVAVITSFGAATRNGFLEQVTTAVADLTGRAPTRFADVVLPTPTSPTK